MRAHLPLLLLLPLAACASVYGAGTPLPSRYLPPPLAGAGEVAIGADLARDLGAGVMVEHEGTPTLHEGSRYARALDLAARYAFTDRLGLEARVTTAMPSLNGFSLAPLIRLHRFGDRLDLHLSPRFVSVSGSGTVADSDKFHSETSAVGLEVPCIASMRPFHWLGLSATLSLRVFDLDGRTDFLPENSQSWSVGTAADWYAFSGGLALAAIFVTGPVQIALGGGLEVGNHPGAADTVTGHEKAESGVLLVPQGGVSIGWAWGGPKPKPRNDFLE
jgi:hypothetical protein